MFSAVRAAAVSMAAQSKDSITLSGSSGTPNDANDTAAGSVAAGWEFRTNGTVWKLLNATGDVQFQDSVEWNASQDSPTDSYWIRFTEQSFSGDGSKLVDPGASWLKVSGASSSNRSFEIDDPPGTGPTTWTMKVEIASDSAGSNIVATGYYRATAEDTT